MDSSTQFHGNVAGHNIVTGVHTSGGTSNFYLNGQPPSSSAAPKPLSTVPFPPDPKFIQRPEISNWISEKLASPGSRAALVGIGGMG